MMPSPILEVIAGTIILFVLGIAFRQSDVKGLSEAGGWMLAAGIAIVIAIIVAVFIAITRR